VGGGRAQRYKIDKKPPENARVGERKGERGTRLDKPHSPDRTRYLVTRGGKNSSGPTDGATKGKKKKEGTAAH